MKTNTMKTKLTMYLVIGALVLLPSIALVLNDAYGYGGGGAGITLLPPAPVVAPPTTPPVVPPVTPNDSLSKMATEAEGVFARTYTEMDATKEATGVALANKVIQTNTSASVAEAVTKFIAYGTYTTTSLGAGERAGVVNSYKTAFGRLPESANDWNDVIKIGNGRWPSTTNASAEGLAKLSFKNIYKRTANMANANDNAAVTVMAYGLRPANRNLNSERASITTFRAIYKLSPTTAADWDMVRAIAYSGATR